ncbi:CobW family GTP-binding protein [Kribbella deserti]|uniref:CobW family GTP-binding protein n=1 Tax=Kribbella deserti TaxID=1926257 RepID=A0ABV6QJ84_9ACTN
MQSLLPVTLLAGLAEETRATVAHNLLRSAAAGTVLIEYDVTAMSGGTVIRIARTTSGVIDREVIEMGHPCVSCAMRASLVPVLVSIAATDKYGAVLVSIPAAGDPQALAEEIAAEAADELRVDAVITVLDGSTFVADMSGEDLLQDRDIPTAAEDGRAVAEVLARHVEYANALIVDDPAATALARAINPHALIHTTRTAASLLGLRLHDPDTAETWVEPGSTCAPLNDEGDVRTLVWQADRPFHPQRLFDALEDIVAGTARGKGTVWLASQPSNRLGWDSFGASIAIGVLGPWLADLPAERWSEVGESHQARALFEWHPEHGDRASYLSITGAGLDTGELRELLDGCLLRRDEWISDLADPFAPYLEGSNAA